MLRNFASAAELTVGKTLPHITERLSAAKPPTIMLCRDVGN